MTQLAFPTIRLGGLPIAVVDRAGSAEAMIAAARGRRGAGLPPIYSTSANGEVLSLCAKDPAARALFAAADHIHADGMPMVVLSRFVCRTALPERVATTDLFDDMAARAQGTDTGFFLLGATADALARAERNIRQRYPALRIAGTHHGHFGPDDEERVIDLVNAARPDILWLGMGVPREQHFVNRNRHRLTGVGLIKTSGGLFDHLAGDKPRAPRWMQASGLEWLHRLRLEPRRLFRRYALTSPHALFLLVTKSA